MPISKSGIRSQKYMPKDQQRNTKMARKRNIKIEEKENKICGTMGKIKKCGNH